MTLNFQARLRHALALARNELLAARTQDGLWIGELSSSALSTATAVCALAVVEKKRFEMEHQLAELADTGRKVQEANDALTATKGKAAE